MLERLTKAQFAAQLETEFVIQLDDIGPVPLQLVEVSERRSTPRHEQFALLFHGPAHVLLHQQLWPLQHAQLGQLELFLVPVGQSQDGFQYEAVFSRLPDHWIYQSP